MTHTKSPLLAIATSIGALCLSILMAGCNNKAAEDTAAIRSMMEKQQADKEAQSKRAADNLAATRAALKKTQ